MLNSQMGFQAEETSLSIEKMILLATASGMALPAIRDTLQRDLDGGGRIFGTFRNAVKNITKNGVEFAANSGSREVYDEAGIEKFRWNTAGGKICDDCLERDGQVETWEYWEMVGLPKSGFSICQDDCRCILEGIT